MNKVFLCGIIGNDPKYHKTERSELFRFDMATKESRTVNETLKEYTDWHRVVCFGRLAIRAKSMVSKGLRIMVEGRIQTRKIPCDDERSIYSTEIVALNIES